MSLSVSQHHREVTQNHAVWEKKPILRDLYAGFYRRILRWVDLGKPGNIIELGSGIGSFREHCPSALCTDLFPSPWVDQVCDAYELPFPENSVSHLVLCDVFHHLERPFAFLQSAERCVAPHGRIVLLEPYISWFSFLVYGLLHPEPVGWRRAIDKLDSPPASRDYYAAQGNATRLFFRERTEGLQAWEIRHAEAFACFAYLLSGGFSKPCFYPQSLLGMLKRVDARLSRFPRLFGARCLVVLERKGPGSGELIA